MLAVASRATPRQGMTPQPRRPLLRVRRHIRRANPPQTDGPTSWSATLGGKFPVDGNAVSQDLAAHVGNLA
jgi:hypothetical protein